MGCAPPAPAQTPLPLCVPRSLPDVGKLSQLKLALKCSPHSQLQVERVEVMNRTTGFRSTYTPEGDGWISASEWADPAAFVPSGSPEQTYTEYEAKVFTADEEDAAYDGEVQLRVIGSEGQSRRVRSRGGRGGQG